MEEMEIVNTHQFIQQGFIHKYNYSQFFFPFKQCPHGIVESQVSFTYQTCEFRDKDMKLIVKNLISTSY